MKKAELERRHRAGRLRSRQGMDCPCCPAQVSHRDGHSVAERARISQRRSDPRSLCDGTPNHSIIPARGGDPPRAPVVPAATVLQRAVIRCVGRQPRSMTSVRFRRCPPGGAPVLIQALVLGSCATAVLPPSQPEFTQPAPVTYERKLSWILQLEDQRILRDPSVVDSELPTTVPLPVIDPQEAVSGSATLDVMVPPPAPLAVADLQRLATDSSAAIRRRAVIAIGRVGLVDGVETLVGALDDPRMEVREMAAVRTACEGGTNAVGK